MKYSVIIIGGGVTGCAIARELSRYTGQVAIVEKTDDVAMGSSRANSAIVHAGYDCDPGTLMAELNVAGCAGMSQLCEELSVPYQNTGSMVVALTQEEAEVVSELKQRGDRNGVPGLSIITGDEAREREPALSADVICALYAPSAGIVSPYELTIALAENAVDNGVDIYRNWQVINIAGSKGAYTVTNQNGEVLHSDYIINAAGVYADEMNNMMEQAPPLRIRPRKGEYILMDRSSSTKINGVIFPTPSKMGKGVLVSATVHGNTFIGPTASDQLDKEDTSTTQEGLDALRRMAIKQVPTINLRASIRSFAGLRAVIDGPHDFVINEPVPGFINFAGICSPGLSSAPAFGEKAVKMLQASGWREAKKADFKPIRPHEVPFSEMSEEERIQAIQRDARYGHIICRCENVTEAEIVRAVTGLLPATTIDGIKLRTRAGMGRCQGGFCTPRVMEILCREQNRDPLDIRKFGGDSWIVCGKLKDKED